MTELISEKIIIHACAFRPVGSLVSSGLAALPPYLTLVAVPARFFLIMIDVCQWRASIGLWYYQIICDNVMNKSLLALLRKGTNVKVKKQSFSAEHSQAPPNSNTAVVEQSISSEMSQRNFNRRKRSSKSRRKKVQSTSSQIPVALPAVRSVQSTSSQIPVVLLAVRSVQSTCSQLQSQLPIMQSSSKTSDWYSGIQIFFLVLLLLILSGDIELNPGPKAGNNYN